MRDPSRVPATLVERLRAAIRRVPDRGTVRGSHAAIIACWLTGVAVPAGAGNASIIVQSTTSTANSGLYEHLLPQFSLTSGITVNVVAVGTGQAIRNAQNCDGDVLLVHARQAEEKFIADGHGVQRFDLMYNDFIVVGPRKDPAGVAGSRDAAGAFEAIATTQALFASRGDNSGTHIAERELWRAAGIDPTRSSGTWYREMGSGMGATLNAAVGMGAYVLTDRASWLAFRNKADFMVALEGDSRLFNQYGVMLVNPARCPAVRAQAGRRFIDWLISEQGQRAIAGFTIAGEQVFFPNAASGLSR